MKQLWPFLWWTKASRAEHAAGLANLPWGDWPARKPSERFSAPGSQVLAQLGSGRPMVGQCSLSSPRARCSPAPGHRESLFSARMEQLALRSSSPGWQRLAGAVGPPSCRKSSLLLAAARVSIHVDWPRPQAAKRAARRVSPKADGKTPSCSRAVGTSPAGCRNKLNMFSRASTAWGRSRAGDAQAVSPKRHFTIVLAAFGSVTRDPPCATSLNNWTGLCNLAASEELDANALILL